MNEILFRAKQKDNGEWVEGVPYAEYMICGMTTAYYDDEIPLSKCVELDYVEIDPDTVCQYTGLTDKNGVRMFKGDIVEAGYYKWRCEVIWDGEGARFICLTKDRDVKIVYISMIDKDNKSVLQVIGNIFDNPELLN